MLNQITLCGRVSKISKKSINEEGTNAKLTIAVQRSFKNAEGVYETDFIDVNIFNSVAENTIEYCKNGDVIGIKGRLSVDAENKLSVNAERVMFLSSNRDIKEENNN